MLRKQNFLGTDYRPIDEEGCLDRPCSWPFGCREEKTGGAETAQEVDSWGFGCALEVPGEHTAERGPVDASAASERMDGDLELHAL
ncbi:hypothetical protein NDU88_004566 [Pleurodeles waltl]|uniref:Uncharacterized protein n=1 Tax=Pleurodeles waltl TaxID=8319 RepID=A0AAV7NLE6_PLEWA|nr:hypothetical protein NDU88_004566 [Pleurodeles waltl]